MVTNKSAKAPYIANCWSLLHPFRNGVRAAYIVFSAMEPHHKHCLIPNVCTHVVSHLNFHVQYTRSSRWYHGSTVLRQVKHSRFQTQMTQQTLGRHLHQLRYLYRKYNGRQSHCEILWHHKKGHSKPAQIEPQALEPDE